jgi:hypothetical protein
MATEANKRKSWLCSTSELAEILGVTDRRIRLSGCWKFLALIAGVATSGMVLFGTDADTITKVVALIGAVGSCVGYMLAEAKVDAANKPE